MEAGKCVVMVPSPRMAGWVPVDWEKVQRRLRKSQQQIERARRRADRIERILYRSFTATAWLWVQQGGKCPYCGKPITWKTGWNKHHITPKSQGGSDALRNLQLLHPECHLLLHNELAEDIREAQKLLSALYSCLDRLDPVPPDVFEGWEWISEWLNIKARALVYRNYLKTDRRAAA